MIGWYEDDWYRQGSSEINCTTDEMERAVEGHLTTEALILNRDGRTTIAGVTAEKWQRKCMCDLNSIERFIKNNQLN